MASTRLWYLAVKKEATTATAVKPTNFLRYREGDIGFAQEIIEANPIQNNRWNPLTAVPGKITTDGEFKLDVDAKEVWFWLMAALWNYTKATLSGAAIKHTFATWNDLISLTVEQLKWNGASTDYEVIRAYGALVDSFEISGSDGLCEMSVKFKSYGVFVKGDFTASSIIWAPATITVKDTRGLVATDVIKLSETSGTLNTENTTVTAVTNGTTFTATTTKAYAIANVPKVELRPQTASYGAQALPFSFVHADFQFGTDLTTAAAAAFTNVENWTFTYENQLEERYGSNAASPSIIAPKGATAKIKFTKFFANSADRDNYLNLTRSALILSLDLWKVIGATAYNYKLAIKMSDVRYTSYEMPTGTDDLYAVDLEGTCFYDSTDARAVLFELQNDVADYAA